MPAKEKILGDAVEKVRKMIFSEGVSKTEAGILTLIFIAGIIAGWELLTWLCRHFRIEWVN